MPITGVVVSGDIQEENTMEPTRDDWELTLRELNSQEMQMRIALETIKAGIAQVEKIIKEMPPTKKNADKPTGIY